MADSSTARTEVLRRIRAATGTASDEATIDAEWHAIRREYKKVASVDREGLLHQLEDRLCDYDAGVYRSDRSGLRDLIGQVLSQRGKHKLAIPEGVPVEWLPSGPEFVLDTRADIDTDRRLRRRADCGDTCHLRNRKHRAAGRSRDRAAARSRCCRIIICAWSMPRPLCRLCRRPWRCCNLPRQSRRRTFPARPRRRISR